MNARMSEKQLQAAVTAICKLYGIAWYHTRDSRGSVPGYPDLTMAGRKLLFRELKTETGRVRPEQAGWLDRLTAAGADADVWRPGDLHSGRIQHELETIR
jgi:hypothetical protein